MKKRILFSIEKKLFVALLTFSLATGGLFCWFNYSSTVASSQRQFEEKYRATLGYLSRSLVQLEKNSEQTMLNAAREIRDADAESTPLTRERLITFNKKLGLTHSFIIDGGGKFVRSTNESPTQIPNLFSFCKKYPIILNSEESFDTTPIHDQKCPRSVSGRSLENF
jgi:hypothetical protein